MKKVAIASLRLVDNKFVFQRRTKDAPINAGLLGHFGGHVELEESCDDAIRRELREETSLPIDELNINELSSFIVEREGKMVEYHPYDIVIDNAEFEVYEGAGAEVHDLKEALERVDLTSSVRYLLEKISRGDYVSAN